MHGHDPDQQDAERADDLLAHCLRDGFDAPTGFQLEQRGLDAVGHSARADRHLAGDLFGGEALSHPPDPALFYDEDDYQAQQDRREEQRRAAIAQTGVEVIPVHGVQVSRGSHLNACETMTSYEGLRAALNQAVADPMVEHIVLDIDSPGGSAVGAFELAADIRAATKVKPITGLVNFMAYSGGYLIAAACSEVVVSLTSGVGSIGVIASHMDRSKMIGGIGVKVTTVFAGAHKNDLSPNEPLTEQSLQVLNDIVQESYQLFTTHVAEYRGRDVADIIATQAAWYRGSAAIATGLADRSSGCPDG